MVYAPHIVRVGSMGLVGEFAALENKIYPRHARVIVRTRRGLEVGQILTTAEAVTVKPGVEQNTTSPILNSVESANQSNGEIIRHITIEDDLLIDRLERNRQAAYEACNKLIQKESLTAILLDVEHLFDGENLFFYFLGEVSDELEAYTEQLAEAYEGKVQFRKFTETLLAGCGPGCGTEQGPGEGCSTCSGCAIASACKSH